MECGVEGEGGVDALVRYGNDNVKECGEWGGVFDGWIKMEWIGSEVVGW